MRIEHTNDKERLLDLHYEYHTLPDDDVERKSELEWVFTDTIQDETYYYNGVAVWVDDASLTDDEVVIMSVEGQVLSNNETFTSLNVEEFILNCI